MGNFTDVITVRDEHEKADELPTRFLAFVMDDRDRNELTAGIGVLDLFLSQLDFHAWRCLSAGENPEAFMTFE